MTLYTDKNLKSKNVMGKKVYIVSNDIDSKENLKSKPNKFQLEKGLFFGSPKAVPSKRLRLIYKIFFCLQNISTQKNQPLPITSSQDKRGGGGIIPPPSFEG